MQDPKTLIELSGSQIDFQADNTVFVLIDYQNEYLDGQLPLFEIRKAVAETKKLLNFARERRMPIFHVVHDGGKRGGLFDLKGDSGQIIDELKPMSGEAIITKTHPNSFHATNLDEAIKETRPVGNILFAGLMTHMCLSSTVRAALDLGYTSTIVASTTTTRNLKDSSGNVVNAESIKTAELAALQDRFAKVYSTVGDLV